MKLKGFRPDKVLYSSIISWYCKCENMKKAMECLESMETDGFEPDIIVYCSIISGYCRCNNIKNAVQWFNIMVESGVAPDVYIYTCLVDRCSKLLVMDIAELLLAKMYRTGFSPNAINDTPLIHGYRKLGNEKAYKLHRYMIKESIS